MAKRPPHQRAVIWWLAVSLGMVIALLLIEVMGQREYRNAFKGGLALLGISLFVLAGFSIDFVIHRRRANPPESYGLSDFVHDLLTED